MTTKIPVPCPDDHSIAEAIKTLEDQRLHVYQLLYFNNMTSPRGTPLCVERDVRGHFITGHLKISVNSVHGGMNGLEFVVYGGNDEEILRFSKMILEADQIGMKKPHKQACCPYAVQIPCVCAWSFNCPIHGETHIGSHD